MHRPISCGISCWGRRSRHVRPDATAAICLARHAAGCRRGRNRAAGRILDPLRGLPFGKRALGLRIVRADGATLSFGRATARHFLEAMITPLVPFAAGYLLAAFTNGKRALHDFMADTFVISTS
jgi:hypothetical protein